MTSRTQNIPSAPTDSNRAAPSAQKNDVLTVLHSVSQLALIISISIWGTLSWPLPLPGVFTGLGCFVVALLLWACFISPRSMIKVDAFGRALVELILIAAATFGLLSVNAPFWVIIVVAGSAAITGFLDGRRSL